MKAVAGISRKELVVRDEESLLRHPYLATHLFTVLK